MAENQIPMNVQSSIPLQGGAAPVQSQTPLQVDSRLPLAVKKYEAFDPVENASRMYTLADKAEKFKENQAARIEAQTEREDTARDKAILDRYLKGGGDLYSPEGIEKAQDALKDKVSVNTYQNLGTMLDKRKKSVQEFKQKAADLDDTQLTLYQRRYEDSLKTMMGPLDAYDKVKQEKGEGEAQKAFMAAKLANIKMMMEEVDPNTGKPKYAPDTLKKFAAMTPEALSSEMNTTKWHRDLIKDELETKVKTAQARSLEARADKYDADVEQGQRKLDFIAEKLKKSGAAATIADDDKTTMAEQVRMFGPQVLSRLGLNNEQRQAIMSRVTELNKGEGISPREGAGAVSSIKSDQKSLDKLVPQLDAITAFEKTADNIGDKLVSIAKKVDKTGVPVLERWVRAGKKNVDGDPDVTEFNARMQTFRTEASRIINNPNLTGVLSDSARHEMEDIIPNAASAEQIERGVNVLKSEAKTRRDYLEDQVKEVKSRINKGAAKDKPTGKEDFPKIDTDTQKMRDNDRSAILNDELKTAKEKLAKLPADASPEDRHRLEVDLAAIQKEVDGVNKTSKTGSKKPTVSNW